MSRENLQVAQEVAPVFPRSFESSSKVVVGEEVSPMSSAVDLSLTRLGRLPRWVLGQEEEVWMCSYFSDDDNNDDEEEEDEEVEVKKKKNKEEEEEEGEGWLSDLLR